MKSIKIFNFWILIQLIYSTSAGPTPKYTYEILEFDSQTSNEDWIELDFRAERISRGKFGFSGFLHLKEDIYDNYTIGVQIERSSYRAGPFMKLPMSVDNITLTEAMNTFYKDIIMQSAQNCSVNAPYFEDTFEAPLTARKVDMNKCDLSTENLPSMLMEGYYRMRVGLYGENKAYVQSLTLVENN